MFSAIFEDNASWKQVKLPVIHESTQISVLERFAEQNYTLGSLKDRVSTTKMWDETNSQKNGYLVADIHFPFDSFSEIFVGAYCSLANPYFQTVRRNYGNNSDYDCIDLTQLPESYYPRAKYAIACSNEEFVDKIPSTPWEDKFNKSYMLVNREFVGTMSERTLVASLLPPKSTFICTLFGTCIKQPFIRTAAIYYAVIFQTVPNTSNR